MHKIHMAPQKSHELYSFLSWVTLNLTGQQTAHRIPLRSAQELLTGHREREPQKPSADT